MSNHDEPVLKCSFCGKELTEKHPSVVGRICSEEQPREANERKDDNAAHDDYRGRSLAHTELFDKLVSRLDGKRGIVCESCRKRGCSLHDGVELVLLSAHGVLQFRDLTLSEIIAVDEPVHIEAVTGFGRNTAG